MKKRILAVMVSVCLILLNLTGFNYAAKTAGKPYEVTMAYLGMNDQPDKALVEAAINKITLKKLNTTVHLMCLPFGSYQQKLQLMLSGNEKLDLVPIIVSNASSYVSSGQVMDLSKMIDQYGTNIKKVLTEKVAKAANINGYVFGVPTQKEWFTDTALVMRKDIVQKLKINTKSIKTLASAESVFAKVKAAYPQMNVLVGGKNGAIARIGLSDGLSDGIGVLMNYGQSKKVVDYAETPEFMSLAQTMHKFYQKGYVFKDMATSTQSAEELMKGGNAFAYITSYKPGFLAQAKAQTGWDLVAAEIAPSYVTTMGVSFITWGISHTSQDPVKTMQFLDFIYNNADVMNLMNWGVEGTHWVYKDKKNNIIGFPKGINSSNSKYNLSLGWELPNQFIMHVWEGNDPSVYKQQNSINKTALKSKAFGFFYDPSKLSNEITAITNVNNQYSASLDCGSVDPKTYIPKYVAALKSAGIDKVIKEKQRQLDAWLAKQGKK